VFTVLNAEKLRVLHAGGSEGRPEQVLPLGIDVQALVPGTAGYMGSSPYAVHYRDLVQTTLATAHESGGVSPECLGESIAEALFRRFARIEELEIRISRLGAGKDSRLLLRLHRTNPKRCG